MPSPTRPRSVPPFAAVTGWLIVRWLHLLAMALFVGGQMLLAAAIVPALRSPITRPFLRRIARRFGWASLGAFVVLAATGSAMAGHFHLWGRGALHVKLVLVGVAFLLVLWHMRRPGRHELEGLIFLVSLAIVWLGVDLAH